MSAVRGQDYKIYPKHGSNISKHLESITYHLTLFMAPSECRQSQEGMPCAFSCGQYHAAVMRLFKCCQTCLQVSNDVDAIRLMWPVDVATPSIILDVVHDGTDVLPVNPRPDGALNSSLHTTQVL